MGYSHYWTSGAFTAAQWAQLQECAVQIIRRARRAGIGIAGWDGSGRPEIGPARIALNGRGPDSFETFSIELAGGHSFCKTGRASYDAAAVALLIVAARINPRFTWRSDGDTRDHVAGEKLAADLPVSGAHGGAAIPRAQA